MYNRIFDIDSRLDEGMFLFGARQVGKSTLLKEKFKDAVYFDLLDSDLRKRLQRKPELFKEALDKYPEKTLVIVDEIQKVPDLLDTAETHIHQHQLITILEVEALDTMEAAVEDIPAVLRLTLSIYQVEVEALVL